MDCISCLEWMKLHLTLMAMTMMRLTSTIRQMWMSLLCAGTSCRRDYQIKISKHENVHVERLDTRYRNSLQIALFLGHLNQYYILKPKLYEQHLKHLENLDYKVQQYKCINMSQDIPLSSTYLAEGMHTYFLEIFNIYNKYHF